MITDILQAITELIRNQVGHDFSFYKHKTILRRIERRMMLHNLTSLKKYWHFLQQNPQEIHSLFQDLLIGVTQFFRDPKAFIVLKKQLLLQLKNHFHDSFRVWVPGCAKGEEVYSIAILMKECLDEINRPLNIQIFGTDINELAINFARNGIYPASISSHIKPERLQRFFYKEEHHYVIDKNIRKMVIFAKQNLVQDPPFTKLDLLCCRNVLIYLNSPLQKKLIPLFHYILKPNALLFLGSSESIGAYTDLFEVVDKKWKIFKRRETLAHTTLLTFPLTASGFAVESQLKGTAMKHSEENLDIGKMTEEKLLNNYAPPCAIVNELGDIVYIHGRTGKYLEPAPGKARFNILEMAKANLKCELTSALYQATIQHKEVTFTNIKLNDAEEMERINLKVTPLIEYMTPGLFMVVFEPINELAETIPEKNHKSSNKWISQITILEQQLRETKQSLQTAIEEYKISTEELQSANEELQSNNEEIETAKEELQSVNEELETVNGDLQNRIDQLTAANDDMKNLLNSTDIALIFLDSNLCIKRFTNKVTELFKLMPTDTGRPLNHFVSMLKYPRLIADAEEVLKTSRPKNVNAESLDHIWYLIRVTSYCYEANKKGIIMTFININEQKQREKTLEQVISLLNNSLQILLIFSLGMNIHFDTIESD